MSDLSPNAVNLPPEQQAIRAKCFHPTGTFVEFKKEEVEQSIPERFEKIVRKYPHRIAIKSRDQLLTYADLNEAANRVAHAILESQGEGNRPVAILMEHGPSILATILGVLKAGKIYVPLDPGYPIERLKFMLEDAQAELIVANNINLCLSRNIADRSLPVINIDKISIAAIRDPALPIPADAFAYILYTSGSTGEPKGVVDSHRNVLHGTLRFTNGLHISADDRLSFTHSCSSSASVRRIFPALLNGASLFPFDVKQGGMQGLVNLLIEEKITYISLGRIRDFVRNLSGEEAFPSLRLVSFGGEIVHNRDVELCRRLFPPHCLVGVWMSTTETGNITQNLIDNETQITGDIVPIGYPAEDMRVMLLDDAGKTVPDGETGEIAVKSRYLSFGYWRRPDLTEARFFADPDGGEERIYFTGDLGRMDLEGCLYHLGRKDDQVKIRGYRVEMAETEAALLKVPNIRKAFVTAFEKDPDDKQLVAYIVSDSDPAPTTTALRHALAKYLPNYMIPSTFVILDALPLTPTGKVDRKGLPGPSMTRPVLDVAYVAPRSPVEQELARLWAEILTLDRVGINDSFFELGGHSLSAVRLISAVIKTFQTDLPLQTLFQSPTIAEMAAILVRHRGKKLSDDEMGRIVTELESLTDEDAQQLLSAASDAANNKLTSIIR